MTHALSLDLRRRITPAIAAGKSRRAATEQFAVSPATAVRLQKRLEMTGSLEPDKVGRRPVLGVMVASWGRFGKSLSPGSMRNRTSPCPIWPPG